MLSNEDILWEAVTNELETLLLNDIKNDIQHL